MRLVTLILFAVSLGASGYVSAADGDFAKSAAPMMEKFCFSCHSGMTAEAGLDLQKLSKDASFAISFKSWDKVLAMLEKKKMPPKDEAQPSDAERQHLVVAVRTELEQAIQRRAGDPGRVVMRRLTGAEYGYTIEDLTGLSLNLERDFVSDAVGGEGFANIGDVQFIQDSTLERYLDAAKKVASHALIGAGPLQFYEHPGKTGQELSALTRINDIYRAHGFRTGSSEGGKAFGLDRYPKAFFAAWKYRYRATLGLGDVTLATLATQESLDARFVEHIWSVVSTKSPSYPMSQIVARWQQLPAPSGSNVAFDRRVRAACDQLYQFLWEWQTLFNMVVTDREENPVFTEASAVIPPATLAHSFAASISRPRAGALPKVYISVGIEGNDKPAAEQPVVIWKNPRVRFRTNRTNGAEQPLKMVTTEEAAEKLAFGEHPAGGAIGAGDFATRGKAMFSFELIAPQTATDAELLVDAELESPSESQVVHLAVSTAEDFGPYQTLIATLAKPDGAGAAAWRAGVLEFARNLPEVSQREASPADKTQIPALFAQAVLKNLERDLFINRMKYYRDDAFLTEHVLDTATRRDLEFAWADMLSSFEYFDMMLKFSAEKHHVELHGRHIGQLDEAQWSQFPAEQRAILKTLALQSANIEKLLHEAEAGHLDDVAKFAQRAWRRPLTDVERERLKTFYTTARRDTELDHASAIRALITRVLVAPAFLYRVEPPASRDAATPLTDWELASRLSYFLWSSLPDDELRRAAAAGELHTAEQLARQAERMLRDPKARRFATQFFGQWFGFYRFDEFRGIDAERFPEFTDTVKSAMYEEAISFFDYIVRNDRPTREILFADYTFLNQALALHYGVTKGTPATAAMTRVTVTDAGRGGLLRLGAVLAITSAPLRTSPVKRGDWLLRRVLGTPVPPPPADAGSIPADEVVNDGHSIRARLEAHRRNASCVNCHSRMDPLGFALENYDPVGRWRDEYRDGNLVEVSGTLNDGTEITGPKGLLEYLKGHEDQFQRMLCVKLLGYALGRSELASDRPLIDEMLADLQPDKDHFSSLVKKIVTSKQFCYHLPRNDAATAEPPRVPPDAKDKAR